MSGPFVDWLRAQRWRGDLVARAADRVCTEREYPLNATAPADVLKYFGHRHPAEYRSGLGASLKLAIREHNFTKEHPHMSHALVSMMLQQAFDEMSPAERARGAGDRVQASFEAQKKYRQLIEHIAECVALADQGPKVFDRPKARTTIVERAAIRRRLGLPPEV